MSIKKKAICSQKVNMGEKVYRCPKCGRMDVASIVPECPECLIMKEPVKSKKPVEIPDPLKV
jgi:ABC-type ATPase with predicted acetyltransferase domain